MTFNDPRFLFLFLPFCVLGFALFGRFGRRSAIGFLALMSLVFYAQWSFRYVFLLLGSILFNFTLSHAIARAAPDEKAQTRWLVAGITVNLGALAYFKYLFTLLNFAGAHTGAHWTFSSVILPLGISFFTFTQIAYLVDLKQGAAKPESLISYTFFVTFFPHLVAGPILHHAQMMPQVREERRYRLNADDVALGLTWFALGLFKKVVIADYIAGYANDMFKDVAHAGFRSGWIGLIVYAFQLYFDFSGYSDMALGLARIFSLRFPINFNSPYRATSITDFWQRWHITLSQYITSYLYSPLLFAIRRRRVAAGKSNARAVQSTAEGFLSMIVVPTLFSLFIAGVWHGAGLQYLAYGLAHGTYITVNHMWRTFAGPRLQKLMDGPQSVLLTFIFVLLAFVLFRANGLSDAFTLYAALLGRHGLGPAVPFSMLLKVAVLFGVVWFMPNTQQILGQTGHNEVARPSWTLFQTNGWQPSFPWFVTAAVSLLLAIALTSSATPFLYFQF